MSQSFQRITAVRSALLAVIVVALLALTAAGASADQRLESFALPSTQGNVDVSKIYLKNNTELRVTVMLPDGYDADPTKKWPVLYLFAGIGDNSEAWADHLTGKITQVAKGFPGIVVMPESGKGFGIDWWNGGARSGPNWERYYLDEMIPTIESKYRILPDRADHAVGGSSMGGYIAIQLAGALPSYFGTAVSLSGLLDVQAPEAYTLLPYNLTGGYDRMWGPPNGIYATAENPTKQWANTIHTRTYVSSGNGTPDFNIPVDTWQPWVVGPVIESAVRLESLRYAALERAAGAPVFYAGVTGIHDWPYWRRQLPRAISWGLFNAPPFPTDASALNWTYTTMAPHGNAWGIGYKFSALPWAIESFKRSGQTLSATGKGTVTINPGAADDDASGKGTQPQCSFTTTLPFTHTLPAGC